MLEKEHTEAVPKLGLNRIEAAEAIGASPATLDRLTIRGLLRPCRATCRRFIGLANSNGSSRKIPSRIIFARNIQPMACPATGLTGMVSVPRPQSTFPAVSPSATGEPTINPTVKLKASNKMKISELKVLSVGRDSYVPKGQREGDMVARCMDGGAVPMSMFVNVHLSGDDAMKHGAKLAGKIIEVEVSGDGRLNIPSPARH